MQTFAVMMLMGTNQFSTYMSLSSLGLFFVLVTSYRNTTLYTKNSSHPVCPVLLGPVMLCMLKDKATYITLFQKITARLPGVKAYLQVYCTDGELGSTSRGVGTGV